MYQTRGRIHASLLVILALSIWNRDGRRDDALFVHKLWFGLHS